MRHAAIAIGLGMVVLGCGCARPGSMPGSVAGGGGVEGVFRPASLRVHPLTRLDTGGDEPILRAHIELRDGWDDEVKGLGTIRVRLGRGPVRAGAPSSSRVWEVDLRDPAQSSSYFDPATRTYRLDLRGLPEWAGQSGTRVQASYTPLGEARESEVIRDELTLEE